MINKKVVAVICTPFLKGRNLAQRYHQKTNNAKKTRKIITFSPCFNK